MGIQKNEPALKHAICDAIQDEITSRAWQASYKKHLKPLNPQQVADQRPPEEMDECA